MFRGAILLLSLLATESAAQPPVQIKPTAPNPPPKYVRFPINGNPEQMLAEFLKTKDGFQKLLQDNWQDLLQQPPENLEKILREKANENLFIQAMVENFLKDNPGLRKGDPAALEDALKRFTDKLEGNREFAEKILKGLEQKHGPGVVPKMNDLIQPGDGDKNRDAIVPKLDDFMDDELSLEDRFNEWLSDVLKNENVQHDLANLFRNAPDLQEAFTDLARSLQGQGANGNWMPKTPDIGGGKWTFDLKPPKIPFELGKFPKLPKFALPKVPQLNLPMPKLANLGLPRLPGFGGMGKMPNAPSGSFGGGDWAYILVAILTLGLLWWFLRKVNWSRKSPDAQVAALLAALPATITTRTQLRKAFDAFALVRLGHKALPWNHRHIARQLGDVPESKDAAQILANLYEMARYTPGDDRLSPTEQDAVRESLAVLAGGAA